MLKVNVIAVGKVKENYFLDGINEYAKRLKKYCDFRILEVQEENYKKVDSSTIKEIIRIEGDRILSLSEFKGKIFCMAIEGEKFSSEGFAKVINQASNCGETITFVIGGSYGLDERVKNKATKLISFSNMTFPHTLFRLMLVEQIYRGFSINQGSPYHK